MRVEREELIACQDAKNSPNYNVIYLNHKNISAHGFYLTCIWWLWWHGTISCSCYFFSINNFLLFRTNNTLRYYYVIVNAIPSSFFFFSVPYQLKRDVVIVINRVLCLVVFVIRRRHLLQDIRFSLSLSFVLLLDMLTLDYHLLLHK